MKIWVATGYWCDETGVIAAGLSRAVVERDALARLKSRPGMSWEGFWLHEVEASETEPGRTTDVLPVT